MAPHTSPIKIERWRPFTFMEDATKAVKLLSISALLQQALEGLDSPDISRAIDQVQSQQAALLPQIQSKIAAHPEFTVFHALEPNGRLTIAHAVRYVVASRLVAELGGHYILFVDDVVASERLALGRDDALLTASANYAIAALRALGLPATVLKSSEFTLPNHELFLRIIANSLKVPAKKVQDSLPPLPGKRDVLTASHLIAPCVQATEALFLNSDFVLAPVLLAPQMELLRDFQPEDPPILLTLPHVLNLKGPKGNSPKPDPKNVFFFEDNPQQIKQKANGAFCTDGVQGNPVFQYVAHVVIPFFGEFEFAGKKYANESAEFAADFAALDKKALKESLAGAVAEIAGRAKDTLLAVPNLDKVLKMPTTIQ
jgi:hypothetical protein